MVIASNLMAMNAQRQFGIVSCDRKKSTEKLSSGYKINRAADDAAGLTISENMRRKIRGLNQAADNVQDGISYCNVAEGALAEISDMINRIEELSVKSANGTNTDSDRVALDEEVQSLVSEMDRIFKSTEFNTLKIWPPVLYPMAVGEAGDYRLYNVKDESTGEEFYGGITYMGHAYSWADLGIGWDDSTHTFTESKDYQIDSKVLVNGSTTPTPIDDYPAKGGTATFVLSTQKGQPGNTVEKKYSWWADDTGIYVDGVMVDGSKWSALGITPGQPVTPGEFSFVYYGQIIEFGVNRTMDWDDFKNAFTEQRTKVDWTSTTTGSHPERPVVNIASDTKRIMIDAQNGGHPEYIDTKYSVVATDSDITVKNSNGIGPAPTCWSNLENTDLKGNSYYNFNSWGTDINGNTESKSDAITQPGTDNNNGSKGLVSSGKATYFYDTDFFGKSLTAYGAGYPGVDFRFNIMDYQAKAEILEDFNSTEFISDRIVSPTKAYTLDKSKEIYVAYSDSNVSFFTQRDILKRDYNNGSEKIADGIITKDAEGKYQVELTNAANGASYIMKSEVEVSEYSDKIIKYCNMYQNTINSKYTSEEERVRNDEYKIWKNDSSKDHIADLSGIKIGDRSAEEFIALYFVPGDLASDYIDDTEASSIWNSFSTTYTDEYGVTQSYTSAEKKKMIADLWEASDEDTKKNIWNNVYTSGEKNAIFNNLFGNKDQTYMEKTLQDYLGKNNIDTIINFTNARKESLYNGIRDGYVNKSVLDRVYVTFEGSNDSDTLKIGFDSNITLSDIIAAQPGYLDYDKKSIGVKQDVVQNLVDTALSAVTFTFGADGASYQDLHIEQKKHNMGSTPYNTPKVDAQYIEMEIQSGAESNNQTLVRYEILRSYSLGINGVHIDTADGAKNMLSRITDAQNKVSGQRSEFGAYVNGFEHCFDNLNNTSENTQAAETGIRDTDMAREMLKLTKQNLLHQIGISMMAQANQNPQSILSLIG